MDGEFLVGKKKLPESKQKIMEPDGNQERGSDFPNWKYILVRILSPQVKNQYFWSGNQP